ncbi:MAG: hypothetical protein JW927_08700 [Deltaproteobacteria bacterium]|nr:hypothetical protein [Deltaproteobacteria bacterium]
MKKHLQIILIVSMLIVSGCAYRHYMGLHGPSIKAYPDIHENVTKDEECLSCHHPDKNRQGPATSHPGFKGCLKCHND